MTTQDIYNYRKVNDNLITGGQPSEDQLRSAAAEGFTTIINLATIDPGHSLADEAGLVQSLGMSYHHIPVKWQDPRVADFEAFESVMAQTSGKKTVLHCAANFRATAFYSLYAMKHLAWSRSQAVEFRNSVWQGRHYPAWEQLIASIESGIPG